MWVESIESENPFTDAIDLPKFKSRFFHRANSSDWALEENEVPCDERSLSSMRAKGTAMSQANASSLSVQVNDCPSTKDFCSAMNSWWRGSPNLQPSALASPEKNNRHSMSRGTPISVGWHDTLLCGSACVQLRSMLKPLSNQPYKARFLANMYLVLEAKQIGFRSDFWWSVKTLGVQLS